MEGFQGYQPAFMGPELVAALPQLSTAQQADAAPVLTYTHYSVQLSRTRRFPYYTATNINGARFQQINREQVFDSGRDEWRVDERATAYQWGQGLYDAPRSDFQRGHMTKREDPQWGSTRELARQAAQDTFYFSNCVPQVAELNTEAWGDLETYILTRQAVPAGLLVNVFTGPALTPDDPEFVTQITPRPLQLPTFFWKVVYYTNDGTHLSRAAFMMGQREALLRRGIIKNNPVLLLREHRTHALKEDYFSAYADAALYQVNTAFVEELTRLRFAPARELYQEQRPRELILRQLEVPLREHALLGDNGPAVCYAFNNIVL